MAKIKKKHTSAYLALDTIKQIKQLAKILPDETFHSILRRCVEIGLKVILEQASKDN